MGSPPKESKCSVHLPAFCPLSPVVPDFFVRRTSFKVSSLEHAAEIDDALIDTVVPLSKAQDGYLGLTRDVCGKHLDYVVRTKWDTAANLVASGPGSPYHEMAVAKLGPLVPGDFETQNFMGDDDKFA